MANIVLTGIKKPITMVQGKTVEIHFEMKDENNLPLDMTGYDLRFQVRPTYDATATWLNGTITNGMVAWVNQASGKFKIYIKPIDTNSGKVRYTKDEPDTVTGFYEVEIDSKTDFPGTYAPWYGPFTILREIVR